MQRDTSGCVREFLFLQSSKSADGVSKQTHFDYIVDQANVSKANNFLSKNSVSCLDQEIKLDDRDATKPLENKVNDGVFWVCIVIGVVKQFIESILDAIASVNGSNNTSEIKEKILKTSTCDLKLSVEELRSCSLDTKLKATDEFLKAISYLLDDASYECYNEYDDLVKSIEDLKFFFINGKWVEKSSRVF